MMTFSFISDCNNRHLHSTSNILSSGKADYSNSYTSSMPINPEHQLQYPLDQISRQHMTSHHRQPVYNYTWLVFKEERWQPFDPCNQFILEETLSVDGTFVDICDSLFPGVKRVRVFPRKNYLSYLGLKYRMSRVLQPDAWSWFT
ncbi:hypothetical protein BCR42DRAFT_407011 [Absidia repens]|uniref:WWE domain-containing protein n=1 Tax=Absidia repens TaxID=90262 RepID=A0A1X2IRR6_9FUNG|nr:hypothetical protein BCR42DRAFT_407011 [Absidia repens]